MTKPLTITATVPAWLMPHFRIDTLLQRVREGKPCTDMLVFWTFDATKNASGYVRVGEAQITVELGTEDEMVSTRIQALKAEIDKARADFLQKQQECLDQISKLQALPMADVIDAETTAS